MWIPQPVNQALTQLRQQARMTQSQLAILSGLTQSQISSFELGVRTPNAEHLRSVGRALSLSQRQILSLRPPKSPGGVAQLLDRFRRNSAPPLEVDDPVYKRLAAAKEKYGSQIDPVLVKFRARGDEEWCRHWLGHIPTNSCDELLPWLTIVGEVKQALPRFLSLQQIQFDTYAVADLKTGRDLRGVVRPCLELPLGDNALALLFPQVPLRTPTRGCRVDILAEIVASRKRLTCVLELDGGGHDYTSDAERTEALKLPVIRFSPTDVLSITWVSSLLVTLRKLAA